MNFENKFVENWASIKFLKVSINLGIEEIFKKYMLSLIPGTFCHYFHTIWTSWTSDMTFCMENIDIFDRI